VATSVRRFSVLTYCCNWLEEQGCSQLDILLELDNLVGNQAVLGSQVGIQDKLVVVGSTEEWQHSLA
jgi:hypothetical protein